MPIAHDSVAGGHRSQLPAIADRRLATDQACELTRLPMVGIEERSDAKLCRKLVRLAAPPVPPRSETNVSKLVCRELAVLEEALEPALDEPESDAARLFTSARSCDPGLVPEQPADDELESALELESAPDCVLSADISACMKF